MQVKINMWKLFPLLPSQYLNKRTFMEYITINIMETFHLLTLLGFNT